MSDYRILVGVPSSGLIGEGCTDVAYFASLKHKVDRLPSTTTGLNFNQLWHQALAQCYAGKYTHFAMTHVDIRVVENEDGLRWADRLIEEMEQFDAAFISTPNAIKDHRGLTSSGIGNPDNPWAPYRRFTTRDLATMPQTFTAGMVGYGDKYLLHNEALSVFDMRKPLWYELNADQTVRCDFNQIERIRFDGKVWIKDQQTEDWKFSRDLWRMGAKTVLSTRVELLHYGSFAWNNKGDWGSYLNGDEDTAAQWREPVAALSS